MDRNFRAALNGFNRTDVVAYIEECAINHEKALRQLRDENARLRADLEALQARQEAAQETVPEPVEAQEEAPQAEEPEVPTQPEPEPEVVPIAPPASSSAEELAAYRRAEAVERAARNRAAALCRQVNAIMDSTSRQLEGSRGDVDTVMSDLNICLRQLNDTFAQLRIIFDDAVQALTTMEPMKPDDEA